MRRLKACAAPLGIPAFTVMTKSGGPLRHTDLAAHIDGFVAVKNRYVKASFPAWTAIGVSRLYEPSAVVEIKVVARRPAK